MLGGGSQLLVESPRPLGLEMGKLLENWGRGLDKQAYRTLLYNYLYLAAWTTLYGFPVSSQGVVTLGEDLVTGA